MKKGLNFVYSWQRPATEITAKVDSAIRPLDPE